MDIDSVNQGSHLGYIQSIHFVDKTIAISR